MEFLVLLSYKTERTYNSKSVTIPTFDGSRWLESRIAGKPNGGMDIRITGWEAASGSATAWLQRWRPIASINSALLMPLRPAMSRCWASS